MKHIKITLYILNILVSSITISNAADDTIDNDEYIGLRYYDNAFSHIANSNIKDPQLIQIRNESQKKIKDYFYKKYGKICDTNEYINSSYDNDINNMLFELYEKISTLSPQNLDNLKQFYSSKIEELNKKIEEIKELYYVEYDILNTFQNDAKKVIEICEYIQNELENYDDYSESLQQLFN